MTPDYRCYLLNANGRIEKRVDLLAGEEGPALDEARRVLNTSGFGAAEVWLRDRLIASLKR